MSNQRGLKDIVKQKSTIRTARWDISPNCNLDCLHCCAEGLFDRRRPDYIEFESAIELLNKLWQNNITHLNILGKEPFLYPHINTILQYACKQGFQVDITTNGTMIKDSDIPFLVNLGLQSIYFSLDGSSPQVNDTIRGDGVFHKTLVTMRKFLSEKERQRSSIQINVNTVLTKLNVLDVHNIIDLCSSIGVNVFKLSHLELIGNASRHFKRLFLSPEEEFKAAEEVIKEIPSYPELKFYVLSSKPKLLEYFYKKYKVTFPIGISGCKACIKEIYIDSIGNISPCLSTSVAFSNRYCRPYKFNIFELEGKSIYSLPFYEEFKSAFPLIKNTYKNYIPCNTCAYLATICYPCPLGFLNGVHREELCLVAERTEQIEGVRQEE